MHESGQRWATSPSTARADEIFDLQARNAALTERLTSLVGGPTGLDLHEELVQARSLLARKDAELNELNELFCAVEADGAHLRAERDDAQLRAINGEAAIAAVERAESQAAHDASERKAISSRLVVEQVGTRVLASALLELDAEHKTLEITHRRTLERSNLEVASRSAALERDVQGRTAAQEALVSA